MNQSPAERPASIISQLALAVLARSVTNFQCQADTTMSMHRRRRVARIFVLGTLLTASRLLGQSAVLTPLPPAPGARVTTVTPEAGYFTEPGIAIDPRDPLHAVGVFQNNVHAAWTGDGGATWTVAQRTEPPDYRVSGDVSVAVDRHGHAFLCHIAFDKTGVSGYWALGGTRNGIFVRRSLDGGRSWEAEPRVLVEHPVTQPGLPWEDMPSIVADTREKSPFVGNLYVGWIEFQVDRTVIFFTRSIDDGLTWEKPRIISRVPGLPRDDNGALVAFRGAVADDGTLYATWTDGKGIVLTSSRDGGKTFAAPHRVLETAPPAFNIANFTRGNGFPNVAVEPRSGRLYVAWGDYRNGDIDIFVASSANRGTTWTTPTRVNDDPLHNGKDQFMQWLAVDPSDGAVYTVFYDRRGDSANVKPIVVLARSTDGARSFRNYAWTEVAFDPRESSFLGDYTGLAALGGRVYGIWPEEAQTPARIENGRRSRNTVLRIGVAEFTGATRR